MRSLFAILLFLVAGLLVVCGDSYAQSPGDATAYDANEYSLKAALLHKFILFTTFPERVDKNRIRVCVGATDQIYRKFYDVLKSESVGQREVSVRHVRFASQTDECDVVYVTSYAGRKLLSETLALNGGFLTIGDAIPGYEFPFMITVDVIGDKLRFQINRELAEKSGIRFSARLLELAQLYKGQAKLDD